MANYEHAYGVGIKDAKKHNVRETFDDGPADFPLDDGQRIGFV